MTTEEQMAEVRKDCNRCYVILESKESEYKGYPSLATPFKDEKFRLLYLPEGAAELYFQIQTTDPKDDGQLCGILADWLNDNRELVMWHNKVTHYGDGAKEELEFEEEWTRLETQAIDLMFQYLAKRFTDSQKDKESN